MRLFVESAEDVEGARHFEVGLTCIVGFFGFASVVAFELSVPDVDLGYVNLGDGPSEERNWKPTSRSGHSSRGSYLVS